MGAVRMGLLRHGAVSVKILRRVLEAVLHPDRLYRPSFKLPGWSAEAPESNIKLAWRRSTATQQRDRQPLYHALCAGLQGDYPGPSLYILNGCGEPPGACAAVLLC